MKFNIVMIYLLKVTEQSGDVELKKKLLDSWDVRAHDDLSSASDEIVIDFFKDEKQENIVDSSYSSDIIILPFFSDEVLSLADIPEDKNWNFVEINSATDLLAMENPHQKKYKTQIYKMKSKSGRKKNKKEKVEHNWHKLKDRYPTHIDRVFEATSRVIPEHEIAAIQGTNKEKRQTAYYPMVSGDEASAKDFVPLEVDPWGNVNIIEDKITTLAFGSYDEFGNKIQPKMYKEEKPLQDRLFKDFSNFDEPILDENSFRKKKEIGKDAQIINITIDLDKVKSVETIPKLNIRADQVGGFKLFQPNRERMSTKNPVEETSNSAFQVFKPHTASQTFEPEPTLGETSRDFKKNLTENMLSKKIDDLYNKITTLKNFEAFKDSPTIETKSSKPPRGVSKLVKPIAVIMKQDKLKLTRPVILNILNATNPSSNIRRGKEEKGNIGTGSKVNDKEAHEMTKIEIENNNSLVINNGFVINSGDQLKLQRQTLAKLKKQVKGLRPPLPKVSKPPKPKKSPPPKPKASQPLKPKASQPLKPKVSQPPKPKTSKPPKAKVSQQSKPKGSRPPRPKGKRPPKPNGSPKNLRKQNKTENTRNKSSRRNLDHTVNVNNTKIKQHNKHNRNKNESRPFRPKISQQLSGLVRPTVFDQQFQPHLLNQNLKKQQPSVNQPPWQHHGLPPQIQNLPPVARRPDNPPPNLVH